MLEDGLREILAAVVEGSYSNEQVSRLVAVSHALALPLLRSRISTGQVGTALIGLSLQDMAYDSVADLFRRDDNGDIVQVKSYFEGIEFSGLSDSALLSHLRRLVFSKTNQALFRMYNEADPTLGKIIRNIKLAIGTLQSFVEIDRFGETWIAPSMIDPLLGQPPFDQARLEREFHAVAKGSEHVPALMAKLSLTLRQQDEFCRAVPLVGTALMFRSLYLRRQEPETSNQATDQHFLEEETAAAIQRACRDVMSESKSRYQRNGPTDDAAFAAYTVVIEKSISLRLLEQDGRSSSYFERLKALMPDLTVDEYHRTHRSRIEYLGRLAYERTIQIVQAGLRES